MANFFGWGKFLAMVATITGAIAAVPSANAQTAGSAIVPPAGPTQGPSWQEYGELAARLAAAEQQIQQLGSQVSGPSRVPHARIDAGGNPHIPTVEHRLATLEKHLQHEDPGPHFPTVRLSGLLQADMGAFDQDPTSKATLGDIQNGVDFRRARLQAIGSVAEFTNYSVEVDFATAGRPSFMDIWGEQTHVPVLGNVRIGHFRQPFGMDAMQSIRQLDFLERSLPFQAFVPFRRVGIMAYDTSDDQMTTWAYSIFRTGGFNDAPLGDSRFAVDLGDNGGFSFSGRATHLLWYDEPAAGRYLLHIGGSYDYGRITAGTDAGNTYQARAVPEFFIGDAAGGGLTAVGTPFFVDTGRLPADQFNLFGVELAGQYGPAHFQAEYLATVVDQTNAPDVYYDGAHVQAGFFLTGEHRTYSRTAGVFDRVHPFTEFFSLDSGFCGWGAWEIVGRWSFLNLTDSDAAPLTVVPGIPVSPNPGRMHDTTLGLNWYWNSYTKVQVNWIHAFLDNQALGDSDTNIYAARFHLDF